MATSRDQPGASGMLAQFMETSALERHVDSWGRQGTITTLAIETI